MNIFKKTIIAVRNFINNFFQNIAIKILAITHFGSRNFFYILFKIVCFAVFIIPYMMFEFYDFVVNLLYFNLMFVPLIAPIFMLFKLIFDNVGTSIFYLVTLPDIVCKTD